MCTRPIPYARVPIAKTDHELLQRFAGACVRRQRSNKGHRIETYPKTNAGIGEIDLTPELGCTVKDYLGSCTSGFLLSPAATRYLAQQAHGAMSLPSITNRRWPGVSMMEIFHIAFARNKRKVCTKLVRP